MEDNNKQIIPINNALANFEQQITIGDKLLGLLNENENIFYEDSFRGKAHRKEWFNNLTNEWKRKLKVENIKTDSELLQILIDRTKFYLVGQSEITDISPLKNLTNLTEVLLSKTIISDLSHLKKLINLKVLFVHENEVADISPLKNLTKLIMLKLTGSFYGENPETCGIAHNEITDLTPLKNLTNLTILTIKSNKIEDCSAIKHLSNLNELDLEDNKLTDLTFLKELTNLKELNLSYNEITDITPLKELSNLIELDLKHNKIIDLEPLANLNNLSTLYLWNGNHYLRLGNQPLKYIDRKEFNKMLPNTSIG